MVRYSRKEYKFVKFEKSTNPKKKYDAILENKETGRQVRVRFGDRNLPQFKDTTGLGLYRKKDTNDKNKRRQFRARFSATKQRQDFKNYYSPMYFSWNFLW
jgi:hypothetical protein